jgi:hypothetical protein
MAGVAAPIETWKLEEVRHYLGRHFPAAHLDDYPRGAAIAHLFTVTESALDRRKQNRHYLLITRQFFDRFSDASALKEALESADVGKSLLRAGDRTVELY